MAQDTEIVLDVKIKAAESANTVKELRTSLKGLKDELNNVEAGSDAFKKLSKSINDTEGKLGDLNDSFSTLTGSGIERTNSSFNLLKEGFLNFDTGKISAGFKGIGSAMSAIPIFLIVEGITYLVTNFKELSQGSGILAKALRVVGDVISYAVDLLYDFTDLIGLTNSELDKQGEAIQEYADKTTSALAEQTKEFDRQIKAAKLAGESTVELEQAKQQAIIDTNLMIAKQIEAFVRAGGELDDEKKKLLTASLNFIKDARLEQKAIEVNHNKEVNDDYKKALDEKKKLMDKDFDDYKKSYKDMDDYRRQIEADFQAHLHQQALDDRKRLETKREEEKAFADEDLNNAFFAIDSKDEKLAESQQKERDERQKTVDQNLATTKQGLQAAQALTDLYFGHQLRQAKGNAQKELEIRKKQFNVNKAFGIANAVVDGFGAVQKALNNPYPLNIVLAVISGVLAAANVAKIASTKFDDGGGAGGGSADTGSLGSASAPVVPQPNNTVTKIEDDGTIKKPEQPVVKAIVVETDMTEKQQRVNTIQESAKFG